MNETIPQEAQAPQKSEEQHAAPGGFIERCKEKLAARKAAQKEERDREVLEFLPAALEVVETPAHPMGRAIALSIATLTVIGLIWAFFGKVDVHATASGQIIPSDRVKQVQPREGGRVEAILVEDGDMVTAGQVLIELDASEARADVARLSGELAEAELNIARLEAVMSFFDAHRPVAHDTDTLPLESTIRALDFDFNSGEDGERHNLARNMAVSDLSAFYARVKTIDGEIQQALAQGLATAGEIQKWEEMAPLLEDRVDAYDYLESEQLAPRQISMELRQDLVEAENNIIIQQAEAQRIEANISGLRDRRIEAVATFEQERLTQLSEARREAAALGQELIKAQTRLENMSLVSPIDGTVQQLSVATEGGVVQPAQQIAIIVPSDVELQIEAEILNKDIGFVEVGQEAEIKVETFPFTKYGLIHGEVLRIDRAAVMSAAPAPSPDPNDPNATRPNEPPPGLTYRARVSMDRDTMMIEGREVQLAPGMRVTVEFKTGQRRIIEFILSPLIRATRESMRER